MFLTQCKYTQYTCLVDLSQQQRVKGITFKSRTRETVNQLAVILVIEIHQLSTDTEKALIRPIACFDVHKVFHTALLWM